MRPTRIGAGVATLVALALLEGCSSWPNVPWAAPAAPPVVTRAVERPAVAQEAAAPPGEAAAEPAAPEATASEAAASEAPAPPGPTREGDPAVAKMAARFVGARRIVVGSRRFPFDCSGLVRAVYLARGIDLYAVPGGAASGVRLIYRYVTSRGRLHDGPEGRPGDLVFFHDTWDRNRDGRLNDPLSHVGIVERVEEDGTVIFVSRVGTGVRRYRMNLAEPARHRTADGRLLNDYLRRRQRADRPGTRYLAGELFAGFGAVKD